MKLGDTRIGIKGALGVTVLSVVPIVAAAAQGCGGSSFNDLGPVSVDEAGTGSETSSMMPPTSVDGSGPIVAADASTAADSADGAIMGNPPPVPPPPGCDDQADPKDSVPCVTDAFGVFVNVTSGSDTNTGGKASPMKTIGAALTKAASSSLPRVYVCEGTYPETLMLDHAHDGISIFGGWSCTDWKYSGTRAKIAPAAPGPVVTFASTLKAITLEDLEITSADATAAGASSVAVLLTTSQTTTFRRAKIQSGAGTPGVAGAAGTAPNGVNAVGGGTMCDGPKDITKGGTGAVKSTTDPFDCANNSRAGSPAPPVGGVAGITSVPCTPGGNGANGLPGTAGTGAQTHGTLSAAGWVPTNGTDGTYGLTGGGGGGGGCNISTGGAGGIGACGSGGGGHGTGAGASIAVASINTDTTFDTCEIITATGAAGGNGGVAPPGATGTAAALGANCPGGNGGNGGMGGVGGGGAGGISVGVIYSVKAPMLNAATTAKLQIGGAGPGGVASGGPTTAKGLDGVSASTLAIP